MAVAGVSMDDGSGTTVPTAEYHSGEVTWWTGYIAFAALMLIMIGCFHAVVGLVGVVRDAYYAVPSKDLLVTVDYTAWGWTHIALGLLAILVAVGMYAGSMLARITAIILAVLSALVNLAFIDAKPVVSVLLIAFDVLLIWAIAVHGREIRELTR